MKGLRIELGNIRADKNMKPRERQRALEVAQGLFNDQMIKLGNELYKLYGKDQEPLIQSLVANIGDGRYKAIGPELRGHLFRGLPVVPSPNKKGGKGNDAIPLPQTTTGLHAYTDSEDGLRTGGISTRYCSPWNYW